MTEEKLFKILEKIGEIEVNNWITVCEIVKYLNSNSAFIKNKELGVYYKNVNLDVNDLNTWSTYDNEECIRLVFSALDTKIQCQAFIYDGNYLSNRKELKFKVEIVLNSDFIIHLKYKLHNAFFCLCDEEYSKFLEQQKINWIDKFQKTFFE